MILFGLATQWVVGAVAFIIAIVMTLAWLKTGRKAMLLGAVAALAVGGGTILVASLIVTDEERVEAEIFDIAQDVVRNDIDAVLNHVHPDAEDLTREAKLQLQRFEFSGVHIDLRRIEIRDGVTPRTALVHIIVTPSGIEKSSRQPIPRSAKRYLQIEFVEQADRWLIRSYEMRDFIEAFQKPKPR